MFKDLSIVKENNKNPLYLQKQDKVIDSWRKLFTFTQCFLFHWNWAARLYAVKDSIQSVY